AVGPTFATPLSLYRTPLGRVLPGEPSGFVYEQGYRPAVTEIGERHPVTAELSGATGDEGEPTWGRWFRQVDVDAASGVTVMDGVEGRPLLILDRVGEGRVARVLSDHMWLWSRGFEGGGPHTDLLRRLSHWLMKEPDLEEERLTTSARGLKLTIERRSMEETVGPVTLSAPGGETTELTLEPAGSGVWRTSVDVKFPGLYKVQSGELAAVAHAGIHDPIEMSKVTATEKKLEPLIDATGGGAFWTRSTAAQSATEAADVDVPRISMLANARVLAGSGWLGLKDREAFVTRGVKLTPMFTGLSALAALLFLIAMAWWREGR
ncbi:MAG: hypothetical protein KAI25_07795, partial [Hyphomicrobiaceae bacterium]|nr:hypothetical protein [Hyphomicrobiaceae bacterium]